jgi:photosystem II stability/assembly factor-like uncharacterized protein
MGVRARCFIVVACAASVLTGCGGGGSSGDGIVLDSSPPVEPASTPVATTPVVTTSAGPTPAATTGITPGPSSTPPSGGTVTPPSVGGTWIEASANLVGLSSECGNVSLASDPAHGLFFAGVALQGLFVHDLGSDQWTHVGEGGEPVINRLQQVVADPDQAATFWESGQYGNGFGVVRTDDAGQSFTRLANSRNSDYLSVDFTDPDRKTLFLGAHEGAVPHLSTDGGRTWRDVTGLPGDLGFASATHVLDARTFLLGSFNGPNPGVFRTTDGGATWTQVFAGGVVGVPVVRDGTIRWLREFGHGLISSADGGLTWTATESDQLSSEAVQLIPMPDGSLVTLGKSHLVATTDDGATWTAIGPELPYAPKHVAYSVAEQSFYVSRFDRSFTDDNPVKPDAIMRLAAG